MDDITTPEQLAEVLSIVTGGEFTPDQLLSNAHALMVLAPDDPRRERIYLAVLQVQEAQENSDRKAVVRHKLEFTVKLLRQMQRAAHDAVSWREEAARLRLLIAGAPAKSGRYLGATFEEVQPPALSPQRGTTTSHAEAKHATP